MKSRKKRKAGENVQYYNGNLSDCHYGDVFWGK